MGILSVTDMKQSNNVVPRQQNKFKTCNSQLWNGKDALSRWLDADPRGASPHACTSSLSLLCCGTLLQVFIHLNKQKLYMALFRFCGRHFCPFGIDSWIGFDQAEAERNQYEEIYWSSSEKSMWRNLLNEQWKIHMSRNLMKVWFVKNLVSLLLIFTWWLIGNTSWHCTMGKLKNGVKSSQL